MRVVRLFVLGCALVASAASIGPGDDPLPDPDTCDDPIAAGVSAIDFMRSSGVARVEDFDVQALIFGPQGGSMMPLYFGLQGPAVPTCAAFNLSLARCLDLACTATEDAEAFSESPALTTYDSAGGRDTKQYLLLLPFEYGPGALVRVRAAVGSIENTLLVWIEEEGAAFPDAGPADAGTAIDARAPDAMP